MFSNVGAPVASSGHARRAGLSNQLGHRVIVVGLLEVVERADTVPAAAAAGKSR